MWWLFLIVSVTQAQLFFPLERKSLSGHGTSRQWRTLFDTNTAVHKQNDGVYFSTVCIGTGKTQCFTVIVDTGSATIAVPCEQCNCGDKHNHFYPFMSDTVLDSGTMYSQCYGEGSCNYGRLLTDTICIGNDCDMKNGITHSFGCCDTFAPSFQRQKADGILGVSPSKNSIWKHFIKEHGLDHNIFSICFGRLYGEMSIGGWDRDTVDLQNNSIVVQYTPMTTTDNFYRINVQSIRIGQKNVAIKPYSPMIDSGSTFSFMRKKNWDVLKDHILDFCTDKQKCLSDAERNPGGSISNDAEISLGCYKFSNENKTRYMDTFPILQFQLDQFNHSAPIDMKIPPHQYFFLSGPFSNVYCIGIFLDMQNVIGANLLENFLIVFKDSPSHMGIASANCNRRLTYQNQTTLSQNQTNSSHSDHYNPNIPAMCVAIFLTCMLIRNCYMDFSRREYTIVPDEEETFEVYELEEEKDLEMNKFDPI